MRTRLILLIAALVCASTATARAKLLVEIVAEKQGDDVLLYAHLQNCLSASLEMTLDLTNMQSSQPAPVRRDLIGPRTLLTTLSKRDRTKAWAYKYRFRYVVGRTGALPDPGAVYQLPFASGSPFPIKQGYGGSFSHPKGTPSEYSIDWAMPVGTPALAARGGRVVGIRDDSDENGLTTDYVTKANLVAVEHADGTIAEYVHLKFHGVAVTLGQNVRAGELVGYSGNTGYSSEPHLHVRISMVKSPGYDESLPVRWDPPLDFSPGPQKMEPLKTETRPTEERVSSERSVDSAK